MTGSDRLLPLASAGVLPASPASLLERAEALPVGALGVGVLTTPAEAPRRGRGGVRHDGCRTRSPALHGLRETLVPSGTEQLVRGGTEKGEGSGRHHFGLLVCLPQAVCLRLCIYYSILKYIVKLLKRTY